MDRRWSVSYAAKSLAAQHPSLAMPLAKRRGHGVLIGPDTEVLIEGYPRSANSFSVAAFEMAQGRKTAIAHHTHAPAHVLVAIRERVPALVLIREPDDCVAEFLLVRKDLSIGQAFRGYVRFYEPLLERRTGFVIGPFSEVTTDYGSVMRRVNEMFGTSFVPFEHTADQERAVFEAMQRYWVSRAGSDDELERRVGRPSEVRAKMVEDLRPSLEVPRYERLRSEAKRLHAAFVPGGKLG
jgi:hypothetical protein